MRLDEYLVSEGLVTSRTRGKRLIERGSVKIDGKVQLKPSHKVNYGQHVTIEGEDEPQGYFKLKGIQDATGVIHEGDSVLDIGSSAGGFLMYASPIAGNLVGIEFSLEFKEPLEAVEKEYPNVKVVFGDAFTMDVFALGGPFDVILNDMTVEPSKSIEILSRFLPVLKAGGRVMQVVKLGDSKHGPEPMVKLLEGLGLKIMDVIKPEKHEAYIVAENNR
jgi:23S rRNA (cytidine1920-2'-O)/16S rRNA (cytidine1409-2'-O)-methyltransferase